LNSLVFPSKATYDASLNSGLSVAEPKYNLPAALATWAKPVMYVPEVADEVVVVGGVVLAVETAANSRRANRPVNDNESFGVIASLR
jgi:hypothetical protein